jgi:hypothetical protein
MAINLEASALLQGRVRPETVRDWRRGRRKAPAWAIALVQEILRSRGRDMLEIADQLENDKKTYRKLSYTTSP